jgi:hypothetical protein
MKVITCLVVGAAGDDDRAVARILDETRGKRRRVPFIEVGGWTS